MLILRDKNLYPQLSITKFSIDPNFKAEGQMLYLQVRIKFMERTGTMMLKRILETKVIGVKAERVPVA